ncbi:hypothetical protein OOK60_08720 [Trichothermofontia sichuanensis B231]|uniref:hypothetical protein n=1 Tax=Trichothermofontia sichuanensis TaxID=3045816 RepID=UPI002246D1E5|nr:hypothetical protein [Trichothermofontia sichuanensis]UZQ56119.1 hypothetical protein OOK60_08720 [Trichothermofontia sichuanensis B231]
MLRSRERLPSLLGQNTNFLNINTKYQLWLRVTGNGVEYRSGGLLRRLPRYGEASDRAVLRQRPPAIVTANS